MAKNNFDHNVIDDFGNEWESYDQSSVDSKESTKTGVMPQMRESI